MSPAQTKLIHIAKKQANLCDDQYRKILADTAGVTSSTKLTNENFENVMAVLEGRGFRERDKPGDYWRRRVNLKGEHIHSREAWKIRELARESCYDLEGLVWRHSHHRTREVELLYPKEAFEIIEMLKKTNAREKPGVRSQEPEAPFLAAGPKARDPRAPVHVPVTDEEIPF